MKSEWIQTDYIIEKSPINGYLITKVVNDPYVINRLSYLNNNVNINRERIISKLTNTDILSPNNISNSGYTYTDKNNNSQSKSQEFILNYRSPNNYGLHLSDLYMGKPKVTVDNITNRYEILNPNNDSYNSNNVIRRQTMSNICNYINVNNDQSGRMEGASVDYPVPTVEYFPGQNLNSRNITTDMYNNTSIKYSYNVTTDLNKDKDKENRSQSKKRKYKTKEKLINKTKNRNRFFNKGIHYINNTNYTNNKNIYNKGRNSKSDINYNTRVITTDYNNYKFYNSSNKNFNNTCQERCNTCNNKNCNDNKKCLKKKYETFQEKHCNCFDNIDFRKAYEKGLVHVCTCVNNNNKFGKNPQEGGVVGDGAIFEISEKKDEKEPNEQNIEVNSEFDDDTVNITKEGNIMIETGE